MNNNKRFISTSLEPEELSTEITLRPQLLKDYIGQTNLKENLNIYIKAAKERKEPLDHTLLFGPPGLGKTTLSIIIANELNSKIHIVSAPTIEKIGDIASILLKLNDYDVLFIDEIHRLPIQVEEFLYSAMEDFKIDLSLGRGIDSNHGEIPLNKFTLIGATTNTGKLSSPLRDRFGILGTLEYYSIDELSNILKRSANILGIEINDEASTLIAKSSRGTPRITNRLLKRIRDFAQIKNNNIIDEDIVKYTLDILEISTNGLDKTDKTIIKILMEHYKGGPIGLNTLAVATSCNSETIETVYEPYLIQQGYLARTPRGRKLTEKAINFYKDCLL